MSKWNKAIISTVLVFLTMTSFAQDGISNGIDEGVMRSSGKIYVVMAVTLTVLAGLIIYLIRLDRKIAGLERGKNL